MHDILVLTILYGIGLIFCIIGHYIDEKINSDNDDTLGLAFFVCAWLLSFLTVPLVIFILFCIIIGLIIKYSAQCIDKLIKD
jgi:hypothetical protein